MEGRIHSLAERHLSPSVCHWAVRLRLSKDEQDKITVLDSLPLRFDLRDSFIRDTIR